MSASKYGFFKRNAILLACHSDHYFSTKEVRYLTGWWPYCLVIWLPIQNEKRSICRPQADHLLVNDRYRIKCLGCIRVCWRILCRWYKTPPSPTRVRASIPSSWSDDSLPLDHNAMTNTLQNGIGRRTSLIVHARERTELWNWTAYSQSFMTHLLSSGEWFHQPSFLPRLAQNKIGGTNRSPVNGIKTLLFPGSYRGSTGLSTDTI